MHTVVPFVLLCRYFTCSPKITNYLIGNVWHRLTDGPAAKAWQA